MTAQEKKPYRLSGVMLVTLLWLFSWPPPFADAGWRIVATTASLSASSTRENLPQIVTYIAQNKVKYETRVWSQIVDLKTQQLLVLNHLTQTYWQGPIDEYVAAMGKRAAQVRAQMDKAIQRIPPEQRLMLEKRGGPFETIAPTLTVTITRSSEQAQVAGYQA